MPFAKSGEASLYYKDVGEGPPILTTHGAMESTLYWSLPGVTDRLVQAGYRVISTDMRGHGRTRAKDGFDVETVAEDFAVVADHLGLERFHLLTHATGGMAGIDFAIRHSDRLLSLMSTDTGSATSADPHVAKTAQAGDRYERIVPVDQPVVQDIIASQKARDLNKPLALPRTPLPDHVFLNMLHASVHPEAAYTQLECVFGACRPEDIVAFVSSFYDNPDPRIEGLRSIMCPSLILYGEHDVLFVEASELMAREIPDAQRIVMKGRGHMTALEDPEGTAAHLIEFLEGLENG